MGIALGLPWLPGPVAVAAASFAVVAFVGAIVLAYAGSRAAAEPVRLPAMETHHASSARCDEFLLGAGAVLAFFLVRMWVGALATVWPVIVILSIASLVLAASGVSLWLVARRIARLPTGTLELADGAPRVRVGDVTLLLTAIPEGLIAGDPVLLLLSGLSQGRTGPYRTGLPIAHAARVWRADGAELARYVRHRAHRHLAWAGLAVVTLALAL